MINLRDGMLESEGLCASEVVWSAPQGAVYNETHLKCFYANAHSMRNKLDELEVLAQSQSYNIIGISEKVTLVYCNRCLQAHQKGQAGQARMWSDVLCEGGSGLCGACS